MGTQGRFKKAPALTIPSGSSTSNVLPSPCIEDFVAILVYAPATLDGATTYVFQVHSNPDATNSDTDWSALCDATGTGIEAPGATKAQLYSELQNAGAIRIKASGNVAADRTWKLTGIETV